MSDIEYQSKEKQFRDLWFSTWRLTYGDEWVISEDMWALKDSVSDAMGNYYTIADAQSANEVISTTINSSTHYKLNNRS